MIAAAPSVKGQLLISLNIDKAGSAGVSYPIYNI